LNNKPRKPFGKDKLIIEKTLPFLNRMVKAGIMKKETVTGWNEPSIEDPRKAIVGIYSFAPKMNIPYKSGKLNVRETGDIEFIDIGIYTPKRSSFYLPDTRYHYKIRGKVKNPPSWVTNEKVMNNWDDVRNATKKGFACQGDFSFHHDMSRHISIGQCWWVFETIDDNKIRQKKRQPYSSTNSRLKTSKKEYYKSKK
jgi:hypothetical protein